MHALHVTTAPCQTADEPEEKESEEESSDSDSEAERRAVTAALEAEVAEVEAAYPTSAPRVIFTPRDARPAHALD